MKITALAALLALGTAVLVSSTTVSAKPGMQAWIGGRIKFGPQMGGQADGPCSAITIVGTYAGGSAHVAAVGPNAGAKECDYRFSVPAGALVKLTVKHSDLQSKPQGTWTNPFIAKLGSNVGYDWLMDGKP